MIGISKNLRLQWPALCSTCPVHQRRAFTLPHGPQVLPFIEPISTSTGPLLTHRPGTSTGPDQLWPGRSPARPADEQSERRDRFNLKLWRQLKASAIGPPAEGDGSDTDRKPLTQDLLTMTEMKTHRWSNTLTFKKQRIAGLLAGEAGRRLTAAQHQPLKGIMGEKHRQKHQSEHHEGEEQSAVAGGLNRNQ